MKKIRRTKKIAAIAVVMTLTLPTLRLIAEETAASQPVYISKMPLTKYTLFANGGWDGNWYVGSNQSWVEKIDLRNFSADKFSGAYIGAKLGRMKSRAVAGKPAWEKESYQGEIYGAVSSAAAWHPAKYLLLTRTGDIPFEADYENALENAGEARWFWTECPLEHLAFGAENYVALWSPNEFMNSVSSAPILAAAWGDKAVDSWIATSTGAWPHMKSGEPLKTPITVFEPAIAIKLIPKNASGPVSVSIISVEDVLPGLPSKKITAAGSGPIEKAWLEISVDNKNWRRLSRYVYDRPYIMVFDPAAAGVPNGKMYLRAAAGGVLGNTAVSRGIEMFVSKPPPADPQKGKKGK